MNDGFGNDLTASEVAEQDDALLRRKEPLLQIMTAERGGDDDALQEGRIAVWQANRRPHVSDAYLHTAARRRIVDVVSGRRPLTGEAGQQGASGIDPLRRRTETLDAVLVAAAAETLDQVALAYHYGEILAAINELSPELRRYVKQRFWGGLSEPEIAALTGKSVATVQRWWAAAKPLLRARLAHLELV